jgi:parvulin-like peptidyl-prolyl isomerase
VKSSHLSLLISLLLAMLPSVLAAPKTLLARGKGVEVTQEQLDEAFINLRATLAAKGGDVPESQRAKVEGQLTEKLALTQILLAKATAEDRKKADDKVKRLIEEQRAKAGSAARFEMQIRIAGLSPQTFEKDLQERAICEEVLDRELRPQLGITPEKIRAYYDQHPEEFRQPERVRLQQVVISKRDPAGAELTPAETEEKKRLAERLLERLKKGESIATLAREYSDDPAGRETAGEYVFPVGRIVPELERVILTMPTNQLSGVINTPYAFHIAKVIERAPGESVPFETVSARIGAALELEAMQEALPAYQQKLFETAAVEFLRR